MHDWSDGEMKMTSMLKKVSGGIVVLLIGIIVIILYASYTCPYTCRPGYIYIVIVLIQRKEFLAETIKKDKK